MARLAERQPDPEFFTFRSMAWGYRAAFIVLRTYCHKYGLRTVRDIIARWAPPEDGNDTGNYIRKVCVLTGLPAGPNASTRTTLRTWHRW